MTEKSSSILLSLLRKSMIRVFYQDAGLIREVVKMTEPILELEIEEYIRAKEEAEERLRRATWELEKQRSKAQQELEKQRSKAQQELEKQRSKAQQELEKYQEKSVRDKELIASLKQQLADLKEKGKEKPAG